MRIAVVLLAAAMVLGTAAAWAGSNADLRPEWSVGQDLVSAASLAVTPPIAAPKSLTLREAVNLALARNTGFRAAINNLLSAREALYVARKQWHLVLTTTATKDQGSDLSTEFGGALDYSLFTGANFSVTAELDRLGSQESSDTITANVRQPLLAGAGSASNAYESVRAARNAYRSALLEYFMSRQNLILSVVNSYFSVVQQRESVKIQKERVQLAEQTVKEMKIRLDEGMIIEVDLLNAQQQLASAQAAEVQTKQSYEEAMDQLMLQLGLKIGGVSELVSEVEYRPEPQDLEADTQQALKLRPELRLAELAIENGEAAVRIARSHRLPTLDLLGSWQRFSNSATDSTWSVGLGASVPIGARELQQNYLESQWALLLARQSLEDTRQQVVADIRSQVRAAGAAQLQVDLADQGVKIADRTVLQSKRLVEEDLRTNRDLLDAQNNLRDSKLGLLNSKTNYFLAMMRLKVAMGLDVAVALPQDAPPAAPPAQPAPAPSTAPEPPRSKG